MHCQRTTRSARVKSGYSRMKQHLAVYGNIHIVRADCYVCGRYALVVDGELQCCGRLIETEPSEIKRMSEPEARRRTPSAAHKKEILEAQNYRCLYCDVSLDGYVFYHGELRKVHLNWDHMAPYVYTLNNHAENFAATCQFCNAWKSSLIFKTVDEVRIYVEAKWEAGGRPARQLRKLQSTVSGETEVAEILQPTVPVPIVESQPPPRKSRKRYKRKPRIKRPRTCKRCGVEWPHPRWQGKAKGFICWLRKVVTQ